MGESGVILIPSNRVSSVPTQPFEIIPVSDVCYPSIVVAKLAIADDLAKPLATLQEQDILFINTLLAETLERSVVLSRVREYFRKNRKEGCEYAG